MASPTVPAATVSDVLSRKLIFVSGKGGVGKSVIARASAEALAQKGQKTLWVVFEDPFLPAGELKKIGPNLWRLNCEASTAFEEYVSMKIGVAALTRIFLQNKLMRYLSKATPGMHELVLIGKVWHERAHYDRVVVDMPSTGYSMAMFQSTANFAYLFRGSPINRDAEDMLNTFGDPRLTGSIIVALPEEMPLRESLELNQMLREFFPNNASAFLVNRKFPDTRSEDSQATESPDQWTSPVPASLEDYILKRAQLEDFNLRLWRQAGLPFGELSYVTPPAALSNEPIVQGLAREMLAKGYAG